MFMKPTYPHPKIHVVLYRLPVITRVQLSTDKPLYNTHLGDRRKWPFVKKWQSKKGFKQESM